MEENYSIDDLLSKLIPEGSISKQTHKIDVIYDGNTDCLGSISGTQQKQIQNPKTASQFSILSHQVQKKHFQIDKKFTKAKPSVTANSKPIPATAFRQQHQQKKKQVNIMNNLMLKMRR